MHVLIAFLIGVGLISGFFPFNPQPKNQIESTVSVDSHIKARGTVTPLVDIEKSNLVHQTYDYSCGSAALATLLNFHLGEDLSEHQVIRGLLQYGNQEKIAQRRAFSLLDMKQFVAALGFKGVGYKATIDDLKGLKRPCIIPITIFSYRHFTVFRGIHKDHIFLADPWRGNISMSLSQFDSIWYEKAIFIVYPKNGEEISALQLTERDLRFIDEYTERHFQSREFESVELPAHFKVDDVPGENQFYKK
ncbi:MAG: C39 family peptidase [Desulfobacterales bacterium]|nr:C39 family peptidase [Desulfobacterales bacterium]